MFFGAFPEVPTYPMTCPFLTLSPSPQPIRIAFEVGVVVAVLLGRVELIDRWSRRPCSRRGERSCRPRPPSPVCFAAPGCRALRARASPLRLSSNERTSCSGLTPSTGISKFATCKIIWRRGGYRRVDLPVVATGAAAAGRVDGPRVPARRHPPGRRRAAMRGDNVRTPATWPYFVIRHRHERGADDEATCRADAERPEASFELPIGHMSPLFGEHDARSRLHERRESQRIPIGQAHAPVRLRAADRRRVRACRGARSAPSRCRSTPGRRDCLARLESSPSCVTVGVPEQIGVVAKLRIELNRGHLPFADRKRVVLAAGGHRRIKQHVTGRIGHRQRRVVLRDRDGDVRFCSRLGLSP